MSDFGKKVTTYFEVALRVEVHGAGAAWSIARRFSHFVDLRSALRGWPGVAALPFPATMTKTGAVAGNDPEVVAARQAALYQWLDSVLSLSSSEQELSASPDLLVFLGMARNE